MNTHIENVSTQQVLLSLYIKLWSYCAGWNRVRFRAKQARYILRTLNIDVCLFPLNSLNAFTTVWQGRTYIVLNREMVPSHITSVDDLLDWLFESSNGKQMRFVFFHEIGHVLLHNQDRKTMSFHDGFNLDSIQQLTENSNHSLKAYVELSREVEADFFALLALVPDRVLVQLSRSLSHHSNGHRKLLLRTHIARMLGETRSEASSFITKLATYRVRLFEEYCGNFYECSKLIADRDPLVSPALVEHYTRACSLASATMPEEVSRNHLNGDISALNLIYSKHPLVRDHEKLKEAITKHYPFEHFLTNTVQSSGNLKSLF